MLCSGGKNEGAQLLAEHKYRFHTKTINTLCLVQFFEREIPTRCNVAGCTAVFKSITNSQIETDFL
jgi:hypothetical protein